MYEMYLKTCIILFYCITMKKKNKTKKTIVLMVTVILQLRPGVVKSCEVHNIIVISG